MARARVSRGAAEKARRPQQGTPAAWTFLTNHAHVLLCISREPEVRMRDLANFVGITERSVQRIVLDLERAGYVVRVRRGRRNRYEVREHLPLRHAVERHAQVASLLALVAGKGEGDGSSS